MDNEHLDEGAVPYVRPSDTIRIRESHAKDVVDKGLQSLTRLESHVKHLRTTLLDFALSLKTICVDEEHRSNTAMPDLAPGASELWTVLQSLTMLLSVSQEKTANELLVDFLQPLEDMHTRLEESKKALDLLRRNRKFDVVVMETQVEKEKKTCMKAMKSLQSSVKALVESKNSTGIFSNITRRRYEKTVKKKILEVQELFRKYQNTINGYNRLFEEYERTAQTPLLESIYMQEGKRLELLKRSTINLEMYLSTVTTAEQTSSILMKHALDSINEAREMSTVPSTLPQHKLRFIYDLPCTPEAFDQHTWPGCSELVWYKGSVQEPSTRKGSIDRRGTMPDIRSNARNVWAISQGDDSDHEFADDLKTIEEDNVEPKPTVASFSLVKPKSIGNWHDGDKSGKPPIIRHPNGPGFQKISIQNTKPVSNSKAPGDVSNELSHLTLSRPALPRSKQTRRPAK